MRESFAIFQGLILLLETRCKCKKHTRNIAYPASRNPQFRRSRLQLCLRRSLRTVTACCCWTFFSLCCCLCCCCRRCGLSSSCPRRSCCCWCCYCCCYSWAPRTATYTRRTNAAFVSISKEDSDKWQMSQLSMLRHTCKRGLIKLVGRRSTARLIEQCHWYSAVSH